MGKEDIMGDGMGEWGRGYECWWIGGYGELVEGIWGEGEEFEVLKLF